MIGLMTSAATLPQNKFSKLKVRCSHCFNVYAGSFYGRPCPKCDKSNRKLALCCGAGFAAAAARFFRGWRGGLAGALPYARYDSACGRRRRNAAVYASGRWTAE